MTSGGIIIVICRMSLSFKLIDARAEHRRQAAARYRVAYDELYGLSNRDSIDMIKKLLEVIHGS